MFPPFPRVTLFAFLLLSVSAYAQKGFVLTAGVDPDEDRWVDSVYQSFTEEERLGQLFMIRAHSDLGGDHVRQVERLIEKYKPGGLCFFQGTPEKQVELINRYQQLAAPLPLFIAVDAEWGLGMRMKESAISFPRQLTLGAIQDNNLLYQMGREIARQLKATGVHINFAPVADINNNPANPVIHTRSFGEDRYNVTVKSYMYMKGLQDAGVMACAKHFPGHGDTDVDSHYDLPVIRHSRARLDSLELYPFQALSRYGVGSMMVAHLQVPALDDRPNRPTTLSRKTVNELLRKEMEFEGLIFTDALEMKGVTKHHASGIVEAEALLAGNDVLVLPEDMSAAVRAIRAYREEGKISETALRASVYRVLRAKYRLGLKQKPDLKAEGVAGSINSDSAQILRRTLIRKALTMVRNRENLIPFQKLDTTTLASLSFGNSSKTAFQDRLGSYARMVHAQSGFDISSERAASLLSLLSEKDAVLVGLHNLSGKLEDNFGISGSALDFLRSLNERTNVVIVNFGTPYALRYFDAFEWVVQAYENDPLTQDLTAQSIFGVFGMEGRLPVTASGRSHYNAGVNTSRLYRMGYGLPAEVGLWADTLGMIPQLMKEATSEKATPGGVVLAAKNGTIIFQKAFGYHTYDRKRPVQLTDVYDLASITKVAATTLALMRLYEQGKVDIDQALSIYLHELKNTDKSAILIRDIMAHHAGLRDWIPFFEQTVDNKRPLSRYYSPRVVEGFEVPVAENLFLRTDFVDSIWFQIQTSELRGRTDYRYSDLGFYWLGELVKRVSGRPLDQYVDEEFYRPLGLQSMRFNPWGSLPREMIVPTEEDRYFRRSRLQGYVHDMGAAMLGGVSGHAGLFSDMNDLAILMQMLMQEGYYGGQRYFQPETVRLFTQRHERSSRRGLGFDLLELNEQRSINLSTRASVRTFGHLGFTGTCTWADPETGILYVFLSNRTFPSMHNYKLVELDTRPRIQDLIYRSQIEEQKGSAPSNIINTGR